MKIIFIAISIFWVLSLNAQVPAPLGPVTCPPQTRVTGDISISVLTGMLKQKLIEETAQINRKIDSASSHTGIQATIEFNIKNVFPAILPTYHKSRPNSNYVRLLFSVDYKIKNLKWNGVPYFDRTLAQVITFSFYCSNWYKISGGVSSFFVSSDRPVLNTASAAEQAIDAVLGGWLTDLVDGKISNALQPQDQAGPVGYFNNYQCSCIGLVAGNAPFREDGVISFGYQAFTSVANPPGIKVAVKSVKRLPGLQNENLPEWESLQLEIFANYNTGVVTVDRMKVGDIVHLPEKGIEATSPGRIGKLVLIFNMTALQGNSGDYSGTIEFAKSNSFGTGQHTIVMMRKKYLPRAGATSPPSSPILVPAYELTFEISRTTGTDTRLTPALGE